MDTLDLFTLDGEEAIAVSKKGAVKDLLDSHPSGLSYVPAFIAVEIEAKILKTLDEQPWLGDLERRVQHYGYRYNYRARRIDPSMRVGDLPLWLKRLGEHMVKRGFFDEVPDQVIVNEYLPGQGITAHIDCEPCFGETIASLSLGSACYMEFSRTDTTDRSRVWLEPRSLVVLQREARHLWRHAIAKRIADVKDGKSIKRDRRVSLTFRKVKASWLNS